MWTMSSSLLVISITVVSMVRECQGCGNGSSAVADCLHTYLERDFSAIEAIVFPKKQNTNRQNLTGLSALDGPELEDQCHRMVEVVECLEEIQPTCRYYHEFFPYRHLVTSLRTAIDWVCTDLRHRFRSLLNAFDCIEKARQKVAINDGQCFQPHIPLNIWQRIIRLQSGTEVCMELTGQAQCIQSSRNFKECPKDGQTAYEEMMKVFLKSWCTPVEMARVAALNNSSANDRNHFIYMSFTVFWLLTIIYSRALT